MKAWIASLCLFLVLIAIIVANAIYVHRVTDHLQAVARELRFEDEKTAADLDELSAYWDHHRTFIALSIGYRELDHVCETILYLRAAYDTKSASDFEAYRRLLSDTADEISRLERFSVENLF